MGDNSSGDVWSGDAWSVGSSSSSSCHGDESCGCSSGMTPVTSDFGSIPQAMGMLIRDVLASAPHQPWLLSILASLLIGLSGIFPLLVIPIEAGNSLKTGAGAKTLKQLLSFAVGGLLADVFLHLLPEAWKHLEEGSQDPHIGHMKIGLWVLAGIFAFILVEMLVQKDDEEKDDTCNSELPHSNGKAVLNNNVPHRNRKAVLNNNGKAALNNNVSHRKKPEEFTNGCCLHEPIEHASSGTADSKPSQKQIAGYLNLVANSIDNFAHGLAVAGSFLVGPRVGLITTAAILLHEVPHELGDFAILLRAGFDRWAAARAQLATATVGILGALAALNADDCHALSDKTAWILPFTSGGFINIALVNVLPDLLKEDDPRESIKQLGSLLGGVGVIALVTLICV